MTYWKRLVSGEQDNVLQFWTDAHSEEEVIIVDTRDSLEYKSNYAAFSSTEEEIGVYLEQSDLIIDLHEKKDLLVEGSIWTDGKRKFEIVDSNPFEHSRGHRFYPEHMEEDCVYVEYINFDKEDWFVEDLFGNTLQIVEGRL